MQTRTRALRNLVLALDASIILASMAFSVGLHEGLRDLVPQLKEPPRFEHYAVLAYLTLPLFLVLIAALGLNRCFERRWTRTTLTLDLLKLHLAVLLAVSAVLFLTQAVVNRSLVAVFLAWTFALMYLERAALDRWQSFQHGTGTGRHRLILVGRPSREMAAVAATVGAETFPAQVLGFLGPDEAEPPDEGAAQLPRRLGDLPDLGRLLEVEAVDQVLFLPPFHRPEEQVAALESCDTVGVTAAFLVAGLPPSRTAPRVVSLYHRPFVSFERSPRAPGPVAIKHFLDILVGALLILGLSPLLAALALLVLVTSGRPILFSQERAGLSGRRFRMLKFRTMVPDAEERRADLLGLNEMSGPVFKLADDPRVTRVGRWLRRFSLDELPQLFNVVSGTMSLVGPRPLPVEEQQSIRGWHRRRLSMKPGITGLWQVSGRSALAFERWMELDLEYVDRWSLALDLRILAKTPLVVLTGRGAH